MLRKKKLADDDEQILEALDQLGTSQQDGLSARMGRTSPIEAALRDANRGIKVFRETLAKMADSA